jgi:carbon-monoxide dehydrogenase large subunit
MADWAGFERRRALARERGRLRGMGLANYIDAAAGMPQERAVIRVSGHGRVQAVIGTQSSGQGHETSFAQMVVEFLGVPFDAVDVHEGDSELVTLGSGTHSSRSMRFGAIVLAQASQRIVEQGRRIAAALLEASEADIDYAHGRFAVVGTDRSLGLFEVAAAAEAQADGAELEASAENAKPMNTYANGCQVCEVEIDPETGHVTLAAWSEVHDAGRVVNPLLMDGQTHGGIVQGVGQALYEAAVYDRESGQLLSGSLADYAMPRAEQFPPFVLERSEVPALGNAFGIKGTKGGILGAAASVINAVVDALKDYGVTHVEMPATPERIWRTLSAAGVEERHNPSE